MSFCSTTSFKFVIYCGTLGSPQSMSRRLFPEPIILIMSINISIKVVKVVKVN
jgi:hypothetical protein